MIKRMEASLVRPACATSFARSSESNGGHRPASRQRGAHDCRHGAKPVETRQTARAVHFVAEDASRFAGQAFFKKFPDGMPARFEKILGMIDQPPAGNSQESQPGGGRHRTTIEVKQRWPGGESSGDDPPEQLQLQRHTAHPTAADPERFRFDAGKRRGGFRSSRRSEANTFHLIADARQIERRHERVGCVLFRVARADIVNFKRRHGWKMQGREDLMEGHERSRL